MRALERRRFLQLVAGGVSLPAIAALAGCGDGGGGALGGGGGGGGDGRPPARTRVAADGWTPASAGIVDALERTGRFDDAVVVVLSDNGASPEGLPKGRLESFRRRTDILPPRTRGGRAVRVGNTPDIEPGPEDTYASYGRAWANLSNTPFRYYKRWVHEGGIAAPFVVHWPAGGLAAGTVVDLPAQLVDVLPTLLECVGATYPRRYQGREVLPAEGRSVLPALRGERQEPVPLYWEHTGNAAIRVGRWKLVREHPGPWELYDIVADRTELHDLAARHPRVVADLAARWEGWAQRVGATKWEDTLALYAERGMGDEEAAG